MSPIRFSDGSEYVVLTPSDASSFSIPPFYKMQRPMTSCKFYKISRNPVDVGVDGAIVIEVQDNKCDILKLIEQTLFPNISSYEHVCITNGDSICVYDQPEVILNNSYKIIDAVKSRGFVVVPEDYEGHIRLYGGLYLASTKDRRELVKQHKIVLQPGDKVMLYDPDFLEKQNLLEKTRHAKSAAQRSKNIRTHLHMFTHVSPVLTFMSSVIHAKFGIHIDLSRQNFNQQLDSLAGLSKLLLSLKIPKGQLRKEAIAFFKSKHYDFKWDELLAVVKKLKPSKRVNSEQLKLYKRTMSSLERVTSVK